MQKEEKPAGQAIVATQLCFNVSKKPAPPPSLAQGLDLPLLETNKVIIIIIIIIFNTIIDYH